MYISPYKGFKFLIVARYDLSGWVEAKLLRTFSSWTIAFFLWEDILYCHGCFRKLVIDGGLENKDIIAELSIKYRIERVVVSAYHPQANEMIERNYKPIVNALSKMLARGSTNWV